MELNLLPVSLRSYITIFMLSGLGAGIITSYNYGSQIALIPEIMIVTQIMAVMNIKYNELSAQNRLDEIDRLFRKSMKLLFFILLPLGCLIFLLSREILEVVFIFKKKSEFQSLDNIAGFMGLFAIVLPFRALDLMISNITTAQQKIKEGVLFATILHVSIAILIFMAVNLFSLTGFYIITIFVYIVIMPAFYYFFLKKVTPFIKIGNWLKDSLLFIILMLIGIVCVFLLKKYLLYKLGLVINILCVTGSIIALTFLVNKAIRYTEYNSQF